MKKLGKLISAEQQLCFTHAIHLAVLDVMYKKKSKQPKKEERNVSEDNNEDNNEDNSEDNSADNSENESDYESEDENEDGGVVIDEKEDEETNLSCSELAKTIKKVRTVVRRFKRFAKKNEVHLQKYVNAEFPGKDLVLLPDVKTRWKSLVTMLERF
ncbi:unnamed protein product [Parnassius apollo]|uniref:(apollo) hypothetical protein n=1 Tax=Parnassius apollo TaxID=110799 RepID=A0A8S3YD68_PARAO|nr:unnamed protein product [Parnassius apollo]